MKSRLSRRSTLAVAMSAGLVALLALVGVLSAPAGAVLSCGGKPATIQRGDGDNDIVGTDGPDVIVAGGGDDSILAGGGRDRVCGGDGTDDVEGESGSDPYLAGEAGQDFVDGGLGGDSIFGGPGSDSGSITWRGGDPFGAELDGEEGDDVIHGGGGRDDVYGEDGSDRAFGDSQGDFIDVSGDLVHDLADGGSGDDYCQIDPGVDATRSCEAP